MTTQQTTVKDGAAEAKIAELLEDEQEASLPAVSGPPNPDVLDMIEQRGKLMDRLIAFAVQSTDESSWEDFGDKPRLNDGGAMRVRARLGIRWTAPKVKKEWITDEGGRYYMFTARADFQIGNSQYDVIPDVVGTCSSRDDFLGTGDPTKDEPVRDFTQVDEGDILKKALANLRVNGISQVTGLKGMSWDRLKAMGLSLDASKVSKVAFRTGAKGGGRGGEWKVPFGDNKDKRAEDLTDKDLTWWAKRLTDGLADASREKYHKFDKVGLEAVNAEVERRKAAKASPPPAADSSSSPGRDASPRTSPDASPATNPHWKKIQQIALEGKLTTSIGEAVKLATGKTKPGDITAEDVAKFDRWLNGPGDEFSLEGGR